MAHQYYESTDLADFPNIEEFTRDQGKAFFEMRKIIRKNEM